MFDKTIKGVQNFLEKVFGKNPKQNKKFSELVDKLPDERKEKIATRVKELEKEAVSKPSDGLQRMSREGKAMLTNLEGICLTKYKCAANVWTIGVGATGTEIKDIKKWPMDKEITIAEAMELLDKSLERYERAVRQTLKVEVEQHVFDALVSFCYNCGVGAVKKATFIKLINKGVKPSDKSVYNAMMKWVKGGGRTIRGLVVRRKKEAKLLQKGVYAGKFKANLAPVNKRGRPVYSRGKTIDLSEYL